MLARRASQEPVGKGGCNILRTSAVAPEFASPASHLGLRGNGKAGWAGWFSDAKMEALRTDRFAAPDAAAERMIAGQMEREAFGQVPHVPPGRVQQPTLHRRGATGIVPTTAPLFWNPRKA